MQKVFSTIDQVPYKIGILSPSGNEIIADEPVENGGHNAGFSPKELLAASLAACTSATLKMYAMRKEWDLQSVKINVELERDENTNETNIGRHIELIGDLTDEQRTILIKVANSCPVHKILSNPIKISTTLKQEDPDE